MTDLLTMRCIMCERPVVLTLDALLEHGNDCVFCGATAGLTETRDDEQDAA